MIEWMKCVGIDMIVLLDEGEAEAVEEKVEESVDEEMCRTAKLKDRNKGESTVGIKNSGQTKPKNTNRSKRLQTVTEFKMAVKPSLYTQHFFARNL